MNELLFLAHLLVIVALSFGFVRLGKEAVISWICLQALLANLFVLKQITLFSFEVTASDSFAVGSILSLNLLRQTYGNDATKKTIQICFYSLICFSLLAQIHLLYTPSPHDTYAPAYIQILSPTPRLLLASLLVFYLVQRLDLFVFAYLTSIWGKSSFTIRNLISLSLSQLVDTFLFTLIGLYGLIDSLYSVFCFSFLNKLAITLILGSITKISTRIFQPKGNI